MASLLFVFGTAFVVGLTGAMMPGPVLIATINRSARMGFKAGPLVVLGHAIIEATLVIAIVVGVGSALERPVIMNPILVGGGVMLIILGTMILNDLRLGKVSLPSGPDLEASRVRESAAKPVIDGILTSASNPYWMVWWATIGLAYIAIAAEMGPLGIPAFYSGHILSDLAWYSMISAGVALGARYISNSAYRLLLGGCSLFLIGLGMLFASRGATAMMPMG